MAEKPDPCGKGLTPECFRAQPKHAKQVFAYRLLGALLGLEYLKRLQVFIGLPLPERVAAAMGALPSIVTPPGIFSALPPALVAMWDSGPVQSTRAEEGDKLVATIRRAIISIADDIDNEIVAAVPGKKIQLRSYALTVAGDVNLTWKSAANAISGAMDFGGTNEARGISHNLGDYPLETVAGEALNLALSAEIGVRGYITYSLGE